MKVAADAMRLKAQGIDVVDFGAGEPDFPTPTHIGAAAHRAIDANFTKYTTNSGTDDLKRAIVERYQTDNGVEYAPSEVIVSAGGKQALFNTMLALFERGRRSDHPRAGLADAGRADQARRRDAGDRSRRTRKTGFALNADTFLAAFTPRTRGIIINSPDNPTGALISEEALTAIAQEAARARDLDPARSLLRQADLRPGRAQHHRRARRATSAIARCCADRRRRPTR